MGGGCEIPNVAENKPRSGFGLERIKIRENAAPAATIFYLQAGPVFVGGVHRSGNEEAVGVQQSKNNPDCSAVGAELRRGRVTPRAGTSYFQGRRAALPELDHAALLCAFRS